MEREIEFMWDGGNTRRFHTVPLIGVDTVGHHSFNVCCIIMVLWPGAPARLLRAAIKHDMAEHIVGDMPAPTKRGLPEYRILGGEGIGVPKSFREAFGEYEDAKAAEYGVSLEQDLDADEAWILKLADSLDGMRFCVQERRMGNKHPKLEEAFENFDSYVVKLLELDKDDSYAYDGRFDGRPEQLFCHIRKEWIDADR